MIKKMLLGFLGLLLIGALVFGAVNRTMALANYPNAGQRYGQQNSDSGIYQGWTEQEGQQSEAEVGMHLVTGVGSTSSREEELSKESGRYPEDKAEGQADREVIRIALSLGTEISPSLNVSNFLSRI